MNETNQAVTVMIPEIIGIFYSSIGRSAAMMRWRYAGVTPMLRRLLSALKPALV